MSTQARRAAAAPRLELVHDIAAPGLVPVSRADTVIVGGGPAGLAPLVAACRAGRLDAVLERGLVVVEQGQAIGAGRIGSYAIPSDSTAETIVSCVRDDAHPALAALARHPATEAVAAHGAGSVPLPLVGRFMAAMGRALHGVIETAPRSAVLIGTRALHTQMLPGGLWSTTLEQTDGTRSRIVSRLVVLATGGEQPLARLETAPAAGRPLLPEHAHKPLQSGEVLSVGGVEAVARRLARCADPRVAILGSSSSAIACAGALLRSPLGRRLGPGAVSVLHRRPLRVFYPSAAAALAEGYDEFGPDDVCPVSGFVFRFAGFRLDSRELVMAARGIGGRAPEPRLRLLRLGVGADAAAQAAIEEADLVIAALGYRPVALPVLGPAGEAVRLQAAVNGPLVDDQCRVLDAAGAPLPGLLGLGLAAGFVSPAAVGGEPSFSGQTNGLWQWQNDIGAIVAARMAEPAVAEALRATF